MPTIYERLGLNFDTDKFGEANVLGEKTLNYLKIQRDTLKDWQYDDIANGTAGNEQYFRNPIAVYCDLIKLTTENLVTNSTSVDYANSFPSSPEGGELINTISNNLIIAIDALKSHTDNISGLVSFMSSMEIPNYDMIISVGSEILRLTVQEDDIANASPMLGSMTSLFIAEDLENSTIILNTDSQLLANSISLIEGEEGSIITSSLTANQINSIVSNVNTAYALVNGSRLHDWNFYNNSRLVLQDMMRVNRFSFLGNTQTYLINNYIGTEKLKNSLANT
jgi:hypothetical protein